jgi:hypothetical protein
MTKPIFLIGSTQKQYACQLINEAPADFVAIIRQKTRSDVQNAKLHAMLTDLQRADTPISHHSIEDLKLIFLQALRAESRVLPTLDGKGMFPIGQRTSTLTKAQFAALIEIIYAYCAPYEVKWSEQ